MSFVHNCSLWKMCNDAYVRQEWVEQSSQGFWSVLFYEWTFFLHFVSYVSHVSFALSPGHASIWGHGFPAHSRHELPVCCPETRKWGQALMSILVNSCGKILPPVEWWAYVSFMSTRILERERYLHWTSLSSNLAYKQGNEYAIYQKVDLLP